MSPSPGERETAVYHGDVDDAALVAGAAGGDTEAFGAMYDRSGGRIHDYLCSILRDRDEAADVLQDTFLVAGARLQQLRDPTKLRPWLYAIARHEALRRIKARSRLEPLGDTEVTSSRPGPDEVAAKDELVDLVAAAAEGLSPRDRAVLDLHLRQGLEGQELGEALGVSASHAYVLLSRLRDQVERSLGALLVTRLGRDGCSGLELVLAGWDGRFSPLMRKRVARHVDVCPTCSDVRRQAVSPLALLAAIPPVVLPPELRIRVLGDLDLVSHQGQPWPAKRGGFPPPVATSRRRYRGLLSAAAAVFLLLGGVSVARNPVRLPSPVTALVGGEAAVVTVDFDAPGGAGAPGPEPALADPLDLGSQGIGPTEAAPTSPGGAVPSGSKPSVPAALPGPGAPAPGAANGQPVPAPGPDEGSPSPPDTGPAGAGPVDPGISDLGPEDPDPEVPQAADPGAVETDPPETTEPPRRPTTTDVPVRRTTTTTSPPRTPPGQDLPLANPTTTTPPPVR
jgi:RNA polymerase sigma factor (sigma-70 family)